MAPTKSSVKKVGNSTPPDKEKSTSKTNKTKNTNNKELIIRPINENILKNFRNFANIYISEATLEEFELTIGSFVKVNIGLKEIILLVDVKNEETGDFDDNVILINQYYLDLYGILLGERANLSKFNGKLEYAKDVEIEMISNDFKIENLIDVGIIYQGLNCSNWYVKSINEGIESKIEELNLENEDEEELEKNQLLTGYLIHPKNTNIKFEIVDKLPPIFKKFKFEDIGGLDNTIEYLKKTIKIPLKNNKLFKSFGIEPPRGFLIYGNSGVGKSMILKSLSSEFRGNHIINIDGSSIISKYLGESELKIRNNFKEAIKYQPSMILIDEIDNLLPNKKNKEESNDIDIRILNTFNLMMDELNGNNKVVVIGVCNEVTSVDLSLRRPGRLDTEIEINIPDIKSRYEILQKQMNKINNKKLNKVNEEELNEIANKTHGYVGSDLYSLVRESIMKAINRYLESDDNNNNIGVTFNDFQNSMKDIRPSAMKEIMLEMPKVRWQDIGGQEELKKKIYEMIELPLKRADKFEKFGIKAPKGLLLYGPPGCSKTMTAKALATESGLNFLAIKGPEIFDKYVGENSNGEPISNIISKKGDSNKSIKSIALLEKLKLSNNISINEKLITINNILLQCNNDESIRKIFLKNDLIKILFDLLNQENQFDEILVSCFDLLKNLIIEEDYDLSIHLWRNDIWNLLVINFNKAFNSINHLNDSNVNLMSKDLLINYINNLIG
ncbi:AAA+-type ATPase, partial [Pichia californica]